MTEYPEHKGVQRWLEDLNRFYRATPALYEVDFGWEGFQWVDGSDYENSVISFLRKDRRGNASVLVVCNFTPVVRDSYRVGAPYPGFWQEVLNSDATEYSGSGQGNFGGRETRPVPMHGFDQSLSLNLPPLGLVVLEKQDLG